MDITEQNLQTLSEYMQHTLNPDISVRKPAEQFLESIEQNKNYPLLLLHLVDKPNVDMTLRVAGAVTFKNYIRRNWKVAEGEPNKIHDEDRVAIKTLIVSLMLKSPEAILKQLSVAVSEIGAHDFPMQWSNLIDEMMEKFASGNTQKDVFFGLEPFFFVSGDFHIINGILQTAHSLFKKYRVQMKSEMLWREIKFVLDKFAKPLTDLMMVFHLSILREFALFFFILPGYCTINENHHRSGEFENNRLKPDNDSKSVLLVKLPGFA